MRLFDAVKESVTAYDVATSCGFKPNRAKMIECPFHDDRHPSMKVDRRYYCFGCGAKGDAIDFIANLYGLSLKDAAIKIAQDFGVYYDATPVSTAELSRIKEKRNAEKLEAEKVRDLCGRITTLHSFLQENRRNCEKQLDDIFAVMKPYVDDFEYMDHLYEQYILNDTSEEKKTDYEGILQEVMKIERKYFGEKDNRESKSDAGDVGERVAV